MYHNDQEDIGCAVVDSIILGQRPTTQGWSGSHWNRQMEYSIATREKSQSG